MWGGGQAKQGRASSVERGGLPPQRPSALHTQRTTGPRTPAQRSHKKERKASGKKRARAGTPLEDRQGLQHVPQTGAGAQPSSPQRRRAQAGRGDLSWAGRPGPQVRLLLPFEPQSPGGTKWACTKKAPCR